jgi:hypothetical protein
MSDNDRKLLILAGKFKALEAEIVPASEKLGRLAREGRELAESERSSTEIVPRLREIIEECGDIFASMPALETDDKGRWNRLDA